MRWFSRSATYTSPAASVAMLCGTLKQPGSVPGSPHDEMCRPLGSNLCTRQLPYPSEMYTSPVRGHSATCVGRLNGLPPYSVDGVSGSPMVSSSSPSGVNCRMV